MFTEPINKSDHRGYNNKKFSRREELKGTQSTNDRENKYVVLYCIAAILYRSCSEAKQSRTATSN